MIGKEVQDLLDRHDREIDDLRSKVSAMIWVWKWVGVAAIGVGIRLWLT